MREMLDDEICKVCGRPALRGTEEYKFMEGKLHEYIRHMQEEADIKAEELKEKPYSQKYAAWLYCVVQSSL